MDIFFSFRHTNVLSFSATELLHCRLIRLIILVSSSEINSFLARDCDETISLWFFSGNFLSGWCMCAIHFKWFVVCSSEAALWTLSVHGTKYFGLEFMIPNRITVQIHAMHFENSFKYNDHKNCFISRLLSTLYHIAISQRISQCKGTYEKYA